MVISFDAVIKTMSSVKKSVTLYGLILFNEVIKYRHIFQTCFGWQP